MTMMVLRYVKDDHDHLIENLVNKLLPTHSNDAPYGIYELTQQQFVQKTRFFTFTPVATEYRQVTHQYLDALSPQLVVEGKQRDRFFKPVQLLRLRCFMYDDNTGVALHDDFEFNDGAIRWFAFGCCHDYVNPDSLKFVANTIAKRRIHLARTEHALGCCKCGFFNIVDSSG